MIQGKEPYLIDDSYGFPFVYIRVNDYGSSMKMRIAAIVQFHVRLSAHKDVFPKPDVVLGSSPYPLTPLLVLKLAKRYRCKSICEVRDLWPLSLEEYGIIKRGGVIARAMYRLEHKFYKESDTVVFTMPGGAQYVRCQGWDRAAGGDIGLDKVFSVNNGVDLQEFEENLRLFPYEDERLSSSHASKIIYTGSIRRANNIGFLLDAAKLLGKDVVFFLFGDGEERRSLEERSKKEGIDNVFFMGKVDKRFIPSIISQGMVMMVIYSSAAYGLSCYGGSQNKLFDYLAGGKPIVSNLPSDYSIINDNDCGLERRFETPEELASCITEMLGDPASMRRWAENASKTAHDFSFEALADKFINIIER